MIKTLLANLVAVISLIFISQLSYAQETSWSKKIYDKDVSFNELKQEFYQEWSQKDYEKGKGWKQFKRWESFWENRLMPDGSFPDFSQGFNNYNTFKQQYGSVLPENGNWLPLGPFDHITTGSWSSGTGRLNVVVQDPNDASTIYVGAPAGGIWKTTNSGSSWTPLSDFLSVIGISGIAVDPNNSQVIYASTGDSDGGNTYSIGIWKSTDGGTTWNQAGNDFGQGNKVLINPFNTSEVYVAANTGLYKSSNSGSSWNQILSGNIRDIALKPGDGQTIYGVTAEACYTSTDGGANFTTSTGLPGGTNRLAITVSPAEPNSAYILAADGSWAFGGVYKSTDSGLSFQLRNNTTDIFNGSNQAWYDMAVTVSDTDADVLLTGVLNVWRSEDGGLTWTEINSWSNPSGASYTHADIHYLNYFNGNLYCGSDGGIYKSTDNGNNFTDLSDGLQIGQYYTIAGAQNDQNTLAGGLQDNGGYAYTDGSWKCYYGADGMGSAVNESNSDEIWGMIQNGGLYYTTNGGFNLNGVGSPESGRWVTPMLHDNANNRIIAGYSDIYEYIIGSGWNQISTYNFPSQLSEIELFEGDSNIMYASSGNDLAKTVDGGVNFSDIVLPFSESITSIEINPSDHTEIWVTLSGWNNGTKVYHSSNSGATWQNLSLNLPNLPTQIIKYNSTHDGLYVGMDIGVYFYNDIIGTWIPFNDNLPNVIVNDIEINESADLIRIGTYGRGVWESTVYNGQQFDYDLMLLSVDDPRGTYCNAEVPAQISVRNIGVFPINSFSVEYAEDGNDLNIFNYTSTINPGENVTLTLPEFTSTNGSHSLNVSITNINGGEDDNPDNNTGSSNYSTVLNGSEVTVSLSTDCWGNETGLTLTDDLGNVLLSVNQGTLGSQSTNIYTLCLPDGCYDLNITDSYGDGLEGTAFGCAVDGDYSVTASDGTNLLSMTTANFGFSATENFCIGNLINGCNDVNACNYDTNATVNDGSCNYSCVGCTDSEACNYGAAFTIDDGSCDYSCYGCTDVNACNFDENATINSGCDYSCYGCTDEDACNYNSEATLSDDSCTYPTVWFLDSDNDGYGNSDFTQVSCSQPINFIDNDLDCNDLNGEINPDATEECDGVDNDCDGEIDEDLPTSTYYEDLDEDGFGSDISLEACQPSGSFTALQNGDCDDTDDSINPLSDELCGNDLDDNCDGSTDENTVLFYLDLDLDGYGDPESPIQACELISGLSTNDLDCDDARPDVYPGASGTAEGIDNNCDGEISSNESAPCLGDFDSDGLITIADLLSILDAYSCENSCEHDLSGDGSVTSSDIIIFLNLYGNICE